MYRNALIFAPAAKKAVGPLTIDCYLWIGWDLSITEGLLGM
jgi:hypothetical protein